jgi:hypothetical protein
MRFFFISLVVACVIPRRWLLRAGELMIVLFGVISGLSAYGMVVAGRVTLPDQSGVNLFVGGLSPLGSWKWF